MIALPSLTLPPSASVLFTPIAYRYVASYRKADRMGGWRGKPYKTIREPCKNDANRLGPSDKKHL